MLTIALILAAMIAVAALELWLFWRVGERDQRRRIRTRADIDAADAEQRRAPTSGRPRRHKSSAGWRRRHLHVRSVVVLVVLAALLAPEATAIIDAVI